MTLNFKEHIFMVKVYAWLCNAVKDLVYGGKSLLSFCSSSTVSFLSKYLALTWLFHIHKY